MSNTGPLVALAKVNQLSLLQALFEEVFIPPAVHRELLAKTGPEAIRLDAALGTSILLAGIPPIPPNVAAATANLGPGEQQAIALALDRAAPLLIDDRGGRSAARLLGLKVTGTAGLLIQAKAAGHISLVLPVLQAMRTEGYYLSDSLLEAAARLVGETVP